MKDHIRLLEGRVQRAVERLRGAAAERKQFEAEIRDLRVRLESLERAGGAGEAAASRAAVVAELKAAVAELREG